MSMFTVDVAVALVVVAGTLFGLYAYSESQKEAKVAAAKAEEEAKVAAAKAEEEAKVAAAKAEEEAKVAAAKAEEEAAVKSKAEEEALILAVIDGTAPKDFRFATPNKDERVPVDMKIYVLMTDASAFGAWCVKYAGNAIINDTTSPAPLEVKHWSLLGAAVTGGGSLKHLRLLIAAGVDVTTKFEASNTALHFLLSCSSRDLNEEVLRLLLDQGAGILLSLKNDKGETVLHLAAVKPLAATCRILVQAGASLSDKDKAGNTALDLAKEASNYGVIDVLEEEQAKAHSPEAHAAYLAEKSALADAVKAVIDGTAPKGFRFAAPPTPKEAGSAELPGAVFFVAQAIFEQASRQQQAMNGPCFKETSFNGRDVIEAVRNNHEGRLRLMVAAGGAALEAKSYDGKTALHYAVEHGSASNVRLLVNGGATVSAVDGQNKTALDLVLEKVNYREIDVIEVLQEAQAKEAGPAVHEAYLANKEANEAAVAAVIDGTAPKGFRFSTPHKDVHLGIACAVASVESSLDLAALSKLCVLGAGNPELDAYITLGERLNVTQYAAHFGRLPALRLLIAAGADMDIKMKGDGANALHRAAQQGHEAVVRLLIDEGCSLVITDNLGETALDKAKKKGHLAVVAMLEEAAAAAAN